jgi:dTDP-L-rhamnose 4-epimerase
VIFEDGMQRRDFVHVSDVVRANLLAADAPRAVGHAINVGTGDSMRIVDLASSASRCAATTSRPRSPAASAPATSATAGPTSPAPATCSASSPPPTAAPSCAASPNGSARNRRPTAPPPPSPSSPRAA